MPTQPVVDEPLRSHAEPKVRPGPIVVASDGLETSASALAMGQKIARHLGAGLELVSVLEPTNVVVPPLQPPPAPLHRGTTRIQDRRERLHALCHQLLARGTPCATRILIGDPPASIARAAQYHGALVVVTGRVPHGRIERAIRRETPLATARAGRVPVLSVRDGTALPRRAVVAVGSGEAAARLAPIAGALFHDAVAVHLVAVTPPTPTRWDADACLEEEERRLEAQRAFDATTAAWRLPPDVPVETHIVAGEPLRALADFAADVEADLLVVGQTRRPRTMHLPRADLGTRLFRTVSCGILIVPVERHDDGGWQRATAISLVAHEWPAAMRDFTRRNAGRTASLTMEDTGRTPHVAIESWTLSGIACEPATGAITLSLADRMDPTRHLSHEIANPTVLAIQGTQAGADDLLVIGYPGGQVTISLS